MCAFACLRCAYFTCPHHLHQDISCQENNHEEISLHHLNPVCSSILLKDPETVINFLSIKDIA